MNWYEARYHCKDMSLNLVEISDTSLIKYITDEGYNKLSKFWTAYHKEDWVIISPGKQGKSEGLLISQYLFNKPTATECCSHRLLSIISAPGNIVWPIPPTHRPKMLNVFKSEKCANTNV